MPVRIRHDHARCAGAHGHDLFERGHGGAGARPFAFASSKRHFERDRPFAIEHLAIDLTLDFETRSVRGSATLTLQRVDPEAERITLDAIAFDVGSVTVDGKPARFVYDGQTLTVDVPRALSRGELVVAYAATPRKGIYFLAPDEHVKDRPRQAWTQLQEEDARHLFPCHDKPHVKMTTETRIRVPAGFYVLSNGELSSREQVDGGEVFHYVMREPHPSYLVTIVAGEFAVLEAKAKVPATGGGVSEVPVTYLVPPGREDDGWRSFGRTPEMIAWFSEVTGVPYPWKSYAQVVVSDFFFGGMENTTATTMYEHILLDERASLDVTSDDLVAHELAHQWFGDFVTCRDWSDGWLNEGFATFFEHVWREKHLGRDEYMYGLTHDLGSYIGEAQGRYRRPIVCLDYDAPLDLFDRHLYEKGGLVLHVLRTELGDALFWKGVNLYLERHARGVVETRDLQRALEEVSGRSLGRRFEELVLRPGHPEVDVELSWDDGVLWCALKQTQGAQDGVPQAFEVPLDLLVVSAGGEERRERVRLTSRVDGVAVRCPERPRFVVVDPDMRILGDVTVKAPTDMLRAQLAGAKTARGRWLAAQGLAKKDDPVVIEALAKALGDEGEFWGVRAECAEALGKIRAREAFAALESSTKIAHPKVRRAVISALGRFRTAAAVQALSPVALSDASYLVEAEAARALGRTRQGAAFETLLDLIDRRSWAEAVSAGAIDGLAALRDDRALPHLYARTRYGHPSRVRRAAALAIPKVSADRRAREHLEDMLDDVDPILRLDVVRALADMGDGRSRGALRSRAEVELDARVRRRIREAVRDLAERKGSDALKDELDKLQADLADAKARLTKLEARSADPTGEPAADARAPVKGTARARAGSGSVRAKGAKSAKSAMKKDAGRGPKRR